MLRTVADDTPSPAAVTSTDEATGSPDAIYSRTSAERTRFDRSLGSGDIAISANNWQSCLETAKTLYTGARRQFPRRRPCVGRDLPRSTRTGRPSRTSTSPSTMVVRTSVALAA